MEAAGLWMLLAAAIVLLGSGLPAYAVLMGVSVVFGLAGVALGGLEFGLLTALPSRIIGLLENDLLQALPLYVLMGALLNRLPLAERLFRCGVRLGGRSSAAPSTRPRCRPAPGACSSSRSQSRRRWELGSRSTIPPGPWSWTSVGGPPR